MNMKTEISKKCNDYLYWRHTLWYMFSYGYLI